MIYEFVNPNKGFYTIFSLELFFPGETGIAYHLKGIFVVFFGRLNGTAFFLTRKKEHIESHHLIRSFGCRCFLGRKVENTNRESKSKTQVPMAITLIICHLESYSCLARSLLIMATRIKQLLRQKRFGRVTSLESAILGIITFTSRK